MGLKIIGSGFGRTGTMSTKLALEQLGFGPCHHMVEVIHNPDQTRHWAACADGKAVDWEAAFDGYTSQVDFPGASVWEQLIQAFPDAKVIHTERPEEDWWASYSKTIGKFFQHRRDIALPPPVAEVFEVMDRQIFEGVFGGADKGTSIAAYRLNNERVRKLIPADKLLVFTPSDGWEPLCRFLDAPVPEGDFPRSNGRDEFWAIFGGEPSEAA